MAVIGRRTVGAYVHLLQPAIIDADITTICSFYPIALQLLASRHCNIAVNWHNLTGEGSA